MKYLWLVLVCLSHGIVFAGAVDKGIQKEVMTPKIHFFQASSCSDCHDEEAFLRGLKKQYPDTEIIQYDIKESIEDHRVWVDTREALGISTQQLPMTVIGEKAIVGYKNDLTTGEKIRTAVEHYIVSSEKRDIVEEIQKQEALSDQEGEIVIKNELENSKEDEGEDELVREDQDFVSEDETENIPSFALDVDPPESEISPSVTEIKPSQEVVESSPKLQKSRKNWVTIVLSIAIMFLGVRMFLRRG